MRIISGFTYVLRLRSGGELRLSLDDARLQELTRPELALLESLTSTLAEHAVIHGDAVTPEPRGIMAAAQKDGA